MCSRMTPATIRDRRVPPSEEGSTDDGRTGASVGWSSVHSSPSKPQTTNGRRITHDDIVILLRMKAYVNSNSITYKMFPRKTGHDKLSRVLLFLPSVVEILRLKTRTSAGTATFRPRELCGRRYPRQRPHCSVELKWIVAEKVMHSRSDHLCFV